MRKIKLIFVLAVLVSSTFLGFTAAQGSSQVTFKDIKGHWAEATISNIVDRNIVDGFPDGTFRPDATVQRDQFLKLALVSMGYRMEEGDNYWAEPYIQKAIEMNLIQEDEFSQYNVPITREEMANIIVKVTLATEAAPTEPKDTDVMANIKDFTSVQDHYKQNAMEAYRVGLITGKRQGYFSPKDQSTRAEASTVIARYLDSTLRFPFVIPPDKLHIVLEDVNDRKYVFSEGTFIKVYAPVVTVDGGNPVEINDVIETALVLQNTINTMEKGYGEIAVNMDLGSISATFFPSAESIYREGVHFKLEDKIYIDAGSSVPNEVNLWINIHTSQWGEKKLSAYAIRLYKPERVEEYNKEVVEALFKHLFGPDYTEAFKKYHEILKKVVNSESYVETVTYNNREIYIIKYTSGTIEFFATELRF